ncbi:MAG: Sir2 family NAD-dependent protein deacetylase [Candidatus Rokubacteria bacterium]|nr:Sir2 family NAD-dependent protein deacetylase [Candidatus Rokubacteria bacterium]
MTERVARLAAWLADARAAVVFTGAGVSTESGIPDFRSPGGVWDRFDASAMTWPNFIGSVEGRRRYWELGHVTYPVIRAARPNAAHRAVAELHRLGRLHACITQNIDDLHQRAGLPPERVIELHGNAARTRCLGCGAGFTRDEVHAWLDAGAGVPACPGCGGIVKPHTVLFGEAMPPLAMARAERAAREADLLVVVGSSLVVYPAAYIPRHAREAGARLAIVNLTPTPLDGCADLVIRGKAGDVLPAVLAKVRAWATR